MVKNAKIDRLPRGPWLSEEEIEGILRTDADAEFDRLMRERRRGRKGVPSRKGALRLVRFLLPLAACLAAVAYFLWPAPAEESEAVAYIYGERVDDEQVALDMMQETLSAALAQAPSVQDELTIILIP